MGRTMKKTYNTNHNYVQKRFHKQLVNGERRSLNWSKNVYREWFRYAQLTPLTYPTDFGDLSEYSTDDANIDIHQITPNISRVGKLRRMRQMYKEDDKEFNKWWKEKKDLFYEPSEQLNDRIVTKMGRDPNKKKWPINNNYLYLQIDLKDLDKAVIEFNKVMVKEYEKQKNNKKNFKFQSKAKYFPSLPQKNIRLQKLMAYRLAYDMKFNQNKSRIDIVIYLTERGLMEKSDDYDEEVKEYEKRKNNGLTIGDDVFENEVKRVSFFLGKAKAIFKNIENGTFP